MFSKTWKMNYIILNNQRDQPVHTNLDQTASY